MALFLQRFLVWHVPKLVELMVFFTRTLHLFYSWFRLQLMAIHCNRRVCTQIHFTRRFSVVERACLMMCITPHWLQCLHVRVTSFSIPCKVSGWLFVASLFFALLLSVCLSLSLCSSLPTSIFFLSWTFIHVDNAKANISFAAAHQGVLLSGRTHSFHRFWAQALWRLPLLGEYWHDLAGGIRRQRHGALVLVWRRTRRWNHRESGIFTTSGLKTSFSL